jgi:hypothetical protein
MRAFDVGEILAFGVAVEDFGFGAAVGDFAFGVAVEENWIFVC